MARDPVKTEFVDHGMCADLNVHWDIGVDGLARSLERDVQMEPLLRPRAREFAFERQEEPELSRELSHWLGLGRGQGPKR